MTSPSLVRGPFTPRRYLVRIAALVGILASTGPSSASAADPPPSAIAAAVDLKALQAAGPRALLQRAVDALGGKEGGREVWSRARTVDFYYDHEALQSYAGEGILASHHYQAQMDGSQSLEVTILKGDGKGSLTRVSGGESSIEVDGQRTALAPDQAQRRMDDFSPGKLFQIPLDFGPSEGQVADADILEVLSVVGVEEVRGRPGVVLRAEEEGIERLRIVLDTQSWVPLETTFESAAGRITYRFGDYRTIVPGLILPFRREFLRNDILLGTVQVRDIKVTLAPEAERKKK